MTTPPPDDISDDEDDLLPASLLDQLAADPGDAAGTLATWAAETWGGQAQDAAAQARVRYPDLSTRELAKLVVERHAKLSRWEGGAAAVPGLVRPELPAKVIALSGTAALARIQLRMVVYIAAIYGHDTSSSGAVVDMLQLQSLHNATGTFSTWASAGTARAATRLVTRHLKGERLKTAKNVVRPTGFDFSRAALLRTGVPLLAIPVGAGINEVSTRLLALRAIKYYDDEALRFPRPPGDGPPDIVVP